MNARILPLLCIIATMMLSANGQTLVQDQQTGQDTSPADAAVEKDSHTLAVEEFFVVMKMKETTDQMMDQMLTMQIQQQPALASFKDVMTKFLRKYVSYDAIKGDMVKLYRTEFSEDEIRQLTAFYHTPVGQKAVSKLPLLAASGARIGMQRVQANMGELQQAIAKRQSELQSQ